MRTRFKLLLFYPSLRLFGDDFYLMLVYCNLLLDVFFKQSFISFLNIYYHHYHYYVHVSYRRPYSPKHQAISYEP